MRNGLWLAMAWPWRRGGDAWCNQFEEIFTESSQLCGVSPGPIVWKAPDPRSSLFRSKDCPEWHFPDENN